MYNSCLLSAVLDDMAGCFECFVETMVVGTFDVGDDTEQ
jgi:hypothetical protein